MWNLERWTDEPLCRAAAEMQTERTDCGHSQEGEGWTRWGSSAEAYAPLYVRQMASGNWLPDAGSSDWCSVTIQRGGTGEGGGGSRREETHVCAESPSRGLQPARLLCPRDSPDKGTGVGSHALLQRIFPTQGSDSGLPPCRWILYHLSHQGSPGILERVAYLFSRGSFQCRNWSGVFFIAGRLFTSWATRETQTYVYLWLIHVDVWQKTIQYYKTIIFSLKNKW